MFEITIPFVSSLITGLLFGLAAGIIANLTGMNKPLELGLVGGIVATLVTWLYLRSHASRVSESLRGYIEPAPIAGEPFKTQTAVRVEIGEQVNGARWMDYVDLDISAGKLYQLAQGLSAGRALTLSTWTGRGKPFTRSEFETIRAEFIARGLARWRSEGNPQQGIELTAKGRAVCHGVAMKTSPPPALNRPKIER